MPWPEKQRRAIYLRIKRTKGEEAARAFLRKHGDPKDHAQEAKRRTRRRRKRSA